MNDPTLQDILNSINKLYGTIQQLIKQVEDLQDILLEQQKASQIQQDVFEEFLKKTKLIPLHSVFTIQAKFHPNIKIDQPAQSQNNIFWLPNMGDCNSKEAQN